MSDAELLALCKEADFCLKEYIARAKQIAEVLADRKSQAIYGKAGQYQGELGCEHAGVEMLCLHRIDFDPDFDREGGYQKVNKFNEEWMKRITSVLGQEPSFYIEGPS